MHYFNKIASFLLLGIVTSSIFLIPKQEEFFGNPVVSALNRVEEQFNSLKEQTPNALQSWRMLQALLMEEFACVQQEGISQEDMKILEKRVRKLATPLLKSVFTQGAKNTASFTDYEKHLLYLITLSSMKMVKEGSIAYRFMEGFSQKLGKMSKINFEQVLGQKAAIKPSGAIKVFNWNTCMLPGELAKYFGGIEPWKNRFSAIVKKIKETNADIVCLQEVHSEFAALKLVESLKSDFAYFYINMGPKMMSADIEDVGLNSGLFVASNFELENPSFYKFKSEHGDKFVNKGFFSAEIKQADMLVTAAHLEPSDFPSSELARFEQLNEVITHLKSSQKKGRLLCGDLNIPWGSREAAFKLINAYFSDPYNDKRVDVNAYSRTFTDYFIEKKGYGSSDILDYFLIFNDSKLENFSFVSERIEGFDEALYKHNASDHHGLLTEINQH